MVSPSIKSLADGAAQRRTDSKPQPGLGLQASDQLRASAVGPRVAAGDELLDLGDELAADQGVPFELLRIAAPSGGCSSMCCVSGREPQPDTAAPAPCVLRTGWVDR